ncbi:heme A synthase [Terrilactibacillus sp. BCM23-1]|uniref:Heme A synthase n=2 Tax=Terrilactibacillus tamarindi TaxID=2599694 RepID=A0A6N8CPQ2_9BACI|nr:heme A synthase [Terrilactibacillus tamarindi]
MNRIWRYLSVFATIMILIVVLMGALVTNTGSQAGCGSSWPLCNGEMIPTEAQKHTIIEVSHRYVTGITGIAVVIQAVWVWFKWRSKETRILAVSSVFFLVLQALLGAAAVIWSQSSYVLALHFGISLLSFASVLLITIVVFEKTYWKTGRISFDLSKGVKWNFVLLGIYTYILVYSGAFVRHTDSSLGCTDFPRCNGEWIPPIVSRAGIQYLHRVLALILVIWLIGTLIYLLKKHKDIPLLSIGLLIAIIFVFLQALSGIFIIQTNMMLVFLLLHAFFVTCFFGILVGLTMVTLRKHTK